MLPPCLLPPAKVVALLDLTRWSGPQKGRSDWGHRRHFDVGVVSNPLVGLVPLCDVTDFPNTLCVTDGASD